LVKIGEKMTDCFYRDKMNAAELRAEADRVEKLEIFANEVAAKLLNKHTKDDWYVVLIDQGSLRGHQCKCCLGLITTCSDGQNGTRTVGWRLSTKEDEFDYFESGHLDNCAVPEVERLLQYIEDAESSRQS
jgi:hypothetical protein